MLIVGGSGSGKTRFWIKPNLLQMHSSYVLTDPKGTTVLEVGNAFLKKGYRIKIFNTINFKKSMHYNPFVVYPLRKGHFEAGDDPHDQHPRRGKRR